MVQQYSVPRVNPSEETIRFATVEIRFLVRGDDSNGSAAIFEMTVMGGGGFAPPPHSHDAYEETIYGLEGTLTWTVNGEAIDLHPGQSLCIRRGEVHGFANNGGEDAKALAVVSPAVLGPDYFREVAAVINAASGPLDREALMAIMRRHGLTPARPPTSPADGDRPV